MIFQRLKSGDLLNPPEEETIYLLDSNWDDWFQYSTVFHVHYAAPGRETLEIGSVKIARKDWASGTYRTNIPDTFPGLGQEYFSLGQDETYYTNLRGISEEVLSFVLEGLRDVAADNDLLNEVSNLKVFRKSLLRSLDLERDVKTTFSRIASGGSDQIEFNFSVNFEEHANLKLDFSIKPESKPPTNINAIIGSNGVGKTTLLQFLAKNAECIPVQFGARQDSEEDSLTDGQFRNVVAVSFSAFDNFWTHNRNNEGGIPYNYIGLKMLEESRSGGHNYGLKSSGQILGDFLSAFSSISRNIAKRNLWISLIEYLKADPIIATTNLVQIIRRARDDADLEKKAFKSDLTEMFSNFSSGHKIILLALTRLVDEVKERTLILVDEPETHLHPPLLSAFMRALSHLALHRNAVAIIATHSPVVIQEVPKKCVYKIIRSGDQLSASRPTIETFGENVGILTREIFGLQVTEAGFHALLARELEDGRTPEEVIDSFNGELGDEAIRILYAISANMADKEGYL